MNLVSIIIPVYNVEQYLPKCLDSVINQTYKNLEIILVDDGSTDNSGSICDEYAYKDDRIRVIHKNNGGLSDARNAGLDICTGDYIGFVDSDDFIDSDMYEKLLFFSIKNELDVSMCGAAYVINNKYIFAKKFKPFYVFDKKLIIKEIFINKFGGASISVCNKLFKRNTIKDLRFIVGKTYEDAFIALKWIENTNKFGRISECKYYYVQREGSITHTKKFKYSLLDVVEAYERNLDIIKIKYPEAIDYGIFRLCWAYKVAIDRIYECVDYENVKDYVVYIQNKLRSVINSVFFNKYFSLKEKCVYILLAVDIKAYFAFRKYYQKLKKDG